MSLKNQMSADRIAHRVDQQVEQETGPIIDQIRQANADCAEGKITGAERVFIHQLLMPEHDWNDTLSGHGAAGASPSVRIIRVSEIPRSRFTQSDG